MKFWDTRFCLAARKLAEKLKKTLMKFWDTQFCFVASKRAESLKNTLMKFWDTRFSLAVRKRTEHLNVPWWNFETLAFDWLRENVQKIWKKIPWWIFETLAFDWLRGNVRKSWNYFDEILIHSILLGCEETCGYFKKYLDKTLRHSLFIGCEETYKTFKNTFMKFWDTRFCLATRKRAENLKKIPWWNSETPAFHWLRRNVRNM